ncbi:MAG: lytic murein transglycosylase [Acidobacteriaceae bacterium]|nr:lytic murein transglycosylase [Acidobacteriaceae bacterium]
MRITVLLVALLAVSVSAQTPAPPAAVTTRPAFAEWLRQLKADAIERGIRPEIVDEALSGLKEPLPAVLERDRAQVETVLAIEQYINRQITATRLRDGRRLVTEQRTTLDAVADAYGVPASILAGIWGLESNFGRFSGTRPTVHALATLAWDPRRASFFREELFAALQILDHGDISVQEMRGSWAGAMGQPQFMPSSYLQYAVDVDGDNRRDIWSTPADVFGSIANYLRGHGWTPDQPWGLEVSVPKAAFSTITSTIARREGSCKAMRDMTVRLPMTEWQTLGVRTLNGAPLADSSEEASLVAGSTRRFLVYANYDALLEYNCAHAYALTVALLGEDVLRPSAAPTPIRQAAPQPKKPQPKPGPANPGRRQ